MNIEITYCGECRYWGQALGDARTLLDAAEGTVEKLSLIKGSGGAYEISVDNKTVFSKADNGGFPEQSDLVKIING